MNLPYNFPYDPRRLPRAARYIFLVNERLGALEEWFCAGHLTLQLAILVMFLDAKIYFIAIS